MYFRSTVFQPGASFKRAAKTTGAAADHLDKMMGRGQVLNGINRPTLENRQNIREGRFDVSEHTTAEDLQARLIARAWEDEDFKRRLMSDPKSTICEELGVELPDELEIQVVEEGPSKICVVLPVRPEAVSDDELSEEELKAVAGGIGGGGGGTTSPFYKTTVSGGFTRIALLTPTMPQIRR